MGHFACKLRQQVFAVFAGVEHFSRCGPAVSTRYRFPLYLYPRHRYRYRCGRVPDAPPCRAEKLARRLLRQEKVSPIGWAASFNVISSERAAVLCKLMQRVINRARREIARIDVKATFEEKEEARGKLQRMEPRRISLLRGFSCGRGANARPQARQQRRISTRQPRFLIPDHVSELNCGRLLRQKGIYRSRYIDIHA